MQNSNGGYSSYETKRAGSIMEKINPAEVFGDIMVDYTYVECTSAAMQSLKHFAEQFPDHRTQEIRLSILLGSSILLLFASLKLYVSFLDCRDCLLKGLTYVLSIQKPDGSWEGY